MLPGLGPGWTRLRLPVTVVYTDSTVTGGPGDAGVRARAQLQPEQREPLACPADHRPKGGGGGRRGACGPANRHTGSEAGLAHWQFQCCVALPGFMIVKEIPKENSKKSQATSIITTMIIISRICRISLLVNNLMQH